MASFASLPENIRKIIQRTVEIEGGFVDNPLDPGGATKYGITEQVARRFGYTGHMRDLPLEIACEIYAQQYFFGAKLDRVMMLSEGLTQEIFDTGVNVGISGAWKLVQKAMNTSHVYQPNSVTFPTSSAAREGKLQAAGVKVLQRSLNLCNRSEKDWSDLVVDGGCGRKTLDALAAAVKRRTEKAMDLIFKKVAIAEYIENLNVPTMVIVDGNPGDKTFTELKIIVEEFGEQFIDMVNGQQALFYITLTEKKQTNEEFIFGWLTNRVEL